LAFVLLIATNTSAKTRWSTFHNIPDADLLEGGTLLWNVNCYYLLDPVDGKSKVKPAGSLSLGIIEWVNISGGYAGGPTFGMKVRILGETKDWMPSVALGVRNIFSNEDNYYFGNDADSIVNEVYCALGKGIENLRLRMNFGVMSVPTDKNDKINFFLGAEKYFGNGLYLTLELFRRQKEFVPSLFVDWRFLKRKVELYCGVVDITGLASKEKNKGNFVQPGIQAGLRFYLNLRRGKSDGFTTLEDRLRDQNNTILTLQTDIDSLKSKLKMGTKRIDGLTESVRSLADEATSDEKQYRVIVLEKLVALKNLYEQEPFEPDQVKLASQGLTVHRDKIIPTLIEVALNKNEDTRIRTIATSTCGEIGSSAAADALIEILSQTYVPEIKIEALIALGKLKDIRAGFLIQQLSSDPNDAVAFTALEVLQKLEKETGIPLSSVKSSPIPENVIPENKIGVKEPGSKGLNEILDETTKSGLEMKLQKIEPKTFSEIPIENNPADSGKMVEPEQKTDSLSSNTQTQIIDTTKSVDNSTITKSSVNEKLPPKDTLISESKKNIEKVSQSEKKKSKPDSDSKNKSKKKDKLERKKEDETKSW
jgi:hypothetical protein